MLAGPHAQARDRSVSTTDRVAGLLILLYHRRDLAVAAAVTGLAVHPWPSSRRPQAPQISSPVSR
jgi:hypothetical protein